MEDILVFSGVIAALTLGIVEVLKLTAKLPKNYIPLISVMIGAIIGGLTVFIPEIASELSTGGRILGGVISGLMATGAWEVVRKREGTTK